MSKDLVHWKHLPIVLTPTPGTYDRGGVYSGCCVINNGVPTIIYTNWPGVHPQLQCIATSQDGMITWKKFEGNPVIPYWPRKDLTGFRDPFAWKEGDMWYMIIGAGIKGQGGAVFLYRSKDLVDWELLDPLCTGFGHMWECPKFFPLGDKHVLLVSPHGPVMYTIGTYANHKFTPGPWHKMDLGSKPKHYRQYYSAYPMKDDQGRQIMWAWIDGGGTKGFPWRGCLTLPHVLTLRPDGRLGQQPAPELKQLRGKHWHFDPLTLTPQSADVLPDVAGDCLEIIAEFEPGDAEAFGLKVRCSADGNEQTLIYYDRADKQFVSCSESGPFDLLENEKTLKLHVFLDKSVVEVYINGRQRVTSRIYPSPRSVGLELFTRGGSVKVKSLDIWQMGTIWKE